MIQQLSLYQFDPDKFILFIPQWTALLRYIPPYSAVWEAVDQLNDKCVDASSKHLRSAKLPGPQASWRAGTSIPSTKLLIEHVMQESGFLWGGGFPSKFGQWANRVWYSQGWRKPASMMARQTTLATMHVWTVFSLQLCACTCMEPILPSLS